MQGLAECITVANHKRGSGKTTLCLQFSTWCIIYIGSADKNYTTEYS